MNLNTQQGIKCHKEALWMPSSVTQFIVCLNIHWNNLPAIPGIFFWATNLCPNHDTILKLVMNAQLIF